MFTFFFLLLILSIVGLFVGLVSPTPFSKLLRKTLSRRQVSKGFGWLIAIFLILSSFTAQFTSAGAAIKEAPVAAHTQQEQTQEEPGTESVIEQITDVKDAIAEIVMPAPPSPVTGAATIQDAPVVADEEADAAPPESIPTPTPESAYAPNGTYTNVYGNEVPSPYEAPSKPEGASALCEDGTYSFSQSRRGTCSHHGGVAEWY